MIDWDATLAYREYLWSLGFGVAEAMDTAQRGMGLDWPLALELIQRSYRRREGARSRACQRRGHRPSCRQVDHLTLQDVTERLPGAM